MSCVEVMYQPYASPYLPYQRPGPAATSSMSVDPFKKFSMPRMHEPGLLDHGGGGGGGGHSSSGGGGNISQYSSSSSATAANSIHSSHPHGASPSGSTSSATAVIPKEEGDADRDAHPQNTQYISASCVLLTYFSGDIASNVDDHFTRALSQPSSFSTTSDSSKSSSWKDSSPMSQRNFPPSFWNSAYQPPVTSSSLSAQHYQDFTSGFTTDPYSHMATSLHTMASLQDPWGRYPGLSSQTHTYSPHAAMHDFAYSTMHAAAGSSRFNAAHYSSLLPATRLGSMSQCDPLTKHGADSWSSRYHHSDALGAANLAAASHHTSHLNAAAAAAAAATGLGGGIESTSFQEPSKDLYWF